MGGPTRKGSWKMGGHRLPPVVRGYRPSDVGATTNLTSSGGHYRPCLYTEQISIVASDLSDSSDLSDLSELSDLSDLSEEGTRPRRKKKHPNRSAFTIHDLRLLASC